MTARVHVYEGTDVTVTFDRARCIHHAHCVRHLPAVFDTSKRPWVQPDNADSAAVLAIVAACPTGALHATHRDGHTADAAHSPAVVHVQVTAHGPLFVRGDAVVLNADDTLLATDARIALCRCGLSERKPFCDNTHRRAGWTADRAAEG